MNSNNSIYSGGGILNIIISNASNEPIYEQVASQIKKSIINGVLKEGDALPSIRALAKELEISVITIKRSYEELEKESFIETVHGKGSFVAAQNKDFIREKKMKVIEDKLSEVIDESRLMNISLEELTEMIALLYGEV